MTASRVLPNLAVACYAAVTIACGWQAYNNDPQSDWGKFALCAVATVGLWVFLSKDKDQ